MPLASVTISAAAIIIAVTVLFPLCLGEVMSYLFGAGMSYAEPAAQNRTWNIVATFSAFQHLILVAKPSGCS